MSASRGARLAVAALAAIAGVTVAWWRLALWPVPADGPEWLVRARAVCFGVVPGGLPNAGGWVLLVSQPLSMVVVLSAVWPEALREGFAAMRASRAGRTALTLATALLAIGAALAVWRVRTANAERFDVGAAGTVSVVAGALPPIGLVDQRGDTVTLELFRGRPVIVAFAYAHCATECPLIVHDLLALCARAAGAEPAVVIVTLDPWRDTPDRLPSIASAWSLPASVSLVSGTVAQVEGVLDGWDIPAGARRRHGSDRALDRRVCGERGWPDAPPHRVESARGRGVPVPIARRRRRAAGHHL